jgi:hypothetical protein
MSAHADKTTETKSNAVANGMSVQQGVEREGNLQLDDTRPEAIAQRKIQETANNSPQVKQLKEVKTLANNSPQVKQLRAVQTMADDNTTQLKEINEDETVQEKSETTQLNSAGIADKQNINLPHQAWHVAQQVKVAQPAVKVDKAVQKMANTEKQHAFFRQEKQGMGLVGLAHLPGSSSAATIQRATLEVPVVDYDPVGNVKHDFKITTQNTTGILNAAKDAIAKGKSKVYIQNAIVALRDSADAISSADIPTLATDIYDNIYARYPAANNNNVGGLAQAQKTDLQNAITTKLNAFMSDRIFGHGLQSKADKAEFDDLINVSKTKSQTKGTPNTITENALKGFDAAAKAAATAVDTAFKGIAGVNAANAKARKAAYDIDVATLPAAGRGAHHNVAGWLPALPRPALAPWKAAIPDNNRSSALRWILSEGSPSLYLEFNGGQSASRIVYDPVNNISYATMHYTSIRGYNPFFKIV